MTKNFFSGFNTFMFIQAVSGINFCANFNSPKLKFAREDFFVNIRGYGRNEIWADNIIETTDNAVKMIRKHSNIENIIRFIAQQVREASNLTKDFHKKCWSGLLREPRKNWDYSTEHKGYTWITPYNLKKYKSYSKRFEYIDYKPLTNPYENIIDLTRPDVFRKELIHGNENKVNSALELVFGKCKNVFKKYINKDIAEKELPELNASIAEIRWILAHSTPFKRGSDAISNILMRAIYKSVGIKSYPIKKGISLDLQAYCTELNDYKKNFTLYFEHSPEIIG